MSKTYQITKEACLKSRCEGFVCERCGRIPEPIETVDNAGQPTYWLGCKHGTDSGNFTHGIIKEMYDLAYKIVRSNDMYFNYSMYEYTDYSFEYWFEESMNHVCRMLQTIEYAKTGVPQYTKTQLRKSFADTKRWKKR